MKRTTLQASQAAAGIYKDKSFVMPHVTKVKGAYPIKTTLVLFVGIMVGMGLVNFNSHYKLQSPLVLQSPVVDRSQVPLDAKGLTSLQTPPASLTPTPTPLATPTKKPTPSPRAGLSSIVASIYRLESSSGKNDPCVRDGKGFNGYGFAPGTCYSSHEEVTQLVTNWFEKCTQTNGHSLAHCACSYNLGPNSDAKLACENLSEDYPYYKNLLSYL